MSKNPKTNDKIVLKRTEICVVPANRFQRCPLSRPRYTVVVSYRLLLYTNQAQTDYYLPVSLDVHFVIAPSVFSNVYLYIRRIKPKYNIRIPLLYIKCNDCRVNIFPKLRNCNTNNSSCYFFNTTGFKTVSPFCLI